MMVKDFSATISSFDNFKPEPQEWLVKVRQRGKKTVKTELCKRWISLDTETAWNHDEENPKAWIYQWAFKFGNQIVIGRRPSEFIKALRVLANEFNLSPDRQISVFVHNLSFDVEYLRQWLVEEFGKARMLCVKPHKFISFEVGGFLFKCTWKLSNKSLRAWSSDLGTTHQKIAEKKIYYEEIHYQDEELKPENWEYQIKDVLVLDEAMEKQLAAYGDTMLTIPLTSTGYVRRDCRRNYRKDRRNRKRFLKTRLCVESYALARDEFEGAISHGYRIFANQTVRPGPGEYIRHRDFRSHYPSQQRTKQFPTGTFVKYGDHLDIDKIRELMKEYNVLMRVCFENLTIRKGVALPCLSATRAYKGRKGKVKIVEDNGRVLSIQGVFEVACTEIDLNWILRQYEVHAYDVTEAWICAKGKMPKYMVETIDAYFLGKTKWKKELARAKEAKEDKEQIIWLSMELMKSKNGLNGIYGMTATAIIRDTYQVDAENNWTQETPDAAKAIDKYYGSENNFNRYQFGIYTTAYGRHELLWYADLITREGGTVLYADTDSLFYVSNDRLESILEAENERRRERALAMGAYVEYEGEKINYDAFELEKEDIVSFRFLHAKCYAYETREEDGSIELHCTIAGVNEWEDATHEYGRVDELGSIDELTKGKKFVRCGGTRAKYVPAEITREEINGHITEYASSCIILNTTKTLKSELETYDEVIDWEVV